MPRRTKKEKLRSSLRMEHAVSPRSNNPGMTTHGPSSPIRTDTIKSLTIVLAIIALEIILYYGTMNNQLSLIMKLR